MTNLSQWQVVITPNVKKRLFKLSRPERERLLQALVDLEKDPFYQDAKSLKGRPEWRLRVGQWQVLLRVDSVNLVIVALALSTRGDIYKK
ncbi:MAG: type II toxin-antitoxin system RelE/ParE family toxin [Dehalococcoidales bacterium]|nr:type II toxin-antitoxin system RelE/ParE family toxin [Dehalococcoidales bacterium]